MLLYSNTINAFLARIKQDAWQILSQEAGLTLRRSRLEYMGMLYPINFVVFEEDKRLGYFDSRFYQIGLNKKLMYLAKTTTLKNILRHELAHLICFLKHGHSPQPHGNEFKQICRNNGWGQNVSKAYGDLEFENQSLEGDLVSERVIQKIKKLLSLASSSNSHESELATIKANALLLQHNLTYLNSSQDDETVYIERVLEGKRNSAKFKAIYEILQLFYVQPVFNYGKNIFYLEVVGSKVNVEMANYVAKFLNQELDFLWKQTQKENTHLKGIANKNAFMRGLAEGYCTKIMKGRDKQDSKSLIKIEKNLQHKVKMAYQRIGHTSTQVSNHCSEAKNLGQTQGQGLSIRPGVKSSSEITKKLGWKR